VDVRFNTNPRYGALDSSREETLARVRARLAALPGVVAVLPQDAQGDHARLTTRTAPSEVEVQIQPAPSGSLTALGVAVERGRDFGPGDRTEDGLVVIDAESAARLWGEQDPVGQIVIADGAGRLQHNGVFTVIGVVAPALAAVGLYAVVAVAVGQRIREIGVRTALGADRRRIVRLFVGRGLRLSVVGMTLGLAASVIVVRLLSLSTVGGEPAAATLVGVSGGVAVFVIAVALLASWLPARRAGGIEPLSALRVE
jgi:ABC-type antimicrobial peptide transport system permease subunit